MKHLIWCADGTGNSPTTWTNVYWLYAMQHIAKEKDVITGYDSGVGTFFGKVPDLISLGFAAGMSKNVRDGYRFFAKYYLEGDSLYIFGFSRGAFCARSIANFMSFCGGILDNKDTSGNEISQKKMNFNINKLYIAYRWGNAFFIPKKIKKKIKEMVQKKYRMRPFSIELLGVWETVASVGMPISKNWYHQVGITPETKTTLHALSLDEKRWAYHPVLYQKKPDKPLRLNEGQTFKEVWFSGVHSDVGGGYEEDTDKQLPHVSLNWMLSHLHAESPLKKAQVHNSDVLGPMHEAGNLWKLLFLIPRKVEAGSTIHQSVLYRCLHGKDHSGLKQYSPTPVTVTKENLIKSLNSGEPFTIERMDT